MIYTSGEFGLIIAGSFNMCNSMFSLRLAKCRSSIMLVFFVFFALSFSAWSEITSINFPQFSTNDPTFQGFGDVQFQYREPLMDHEQQTSYHFNWNVCNAYVQWKNQHAGSRPCNRSKDFFQHFLHIQVYNSTAAASLG